VTEHPFTGPRAAPVAEPGEPETTVSSVRLDELVAMLRRHARLILGVTVLSMAGTAFLAYAAGPVYRAVAVLRLSDQRRALTGGLVDDPTRGADDRFADPLLSQVELLKSRTIAGAVVDSMPILRVLTRDFPSSLLGDVAVAPNAPAQEFRLAFDSDGVVVETPLGSQRVTYGEAAEAGGVRFAVLRPASSKGGVLRLLSRESAITRLLDQLRVRLRLRTDIVDVGYSAPDPARAQEVVNRVVNMFRAANADASQGQAKLRREFLEGQLKVNDSVLADARQALTEFQRRARPGGAGEPPGRAQTELPGLELQRQQLMADRRTDESLLAALRDSATSRKALQTALAVPSVASNPLVQQISTQLVQYERARDSLVSRSPSHPDLPRLGQLTSSTEGRLLRAVQAGVQGTIASVDGQIAAINDLRARRAGSLQQDAEETRLGERVENARKITDDLRIEYQKARIAEAVTVGQVEIVDHADLPMKPAGIGLPEYLGLGLLLGLLLGSGAAFVVDQLGGAIARRAQVEQLGAPVIGVVPHCDSGARDKGVTSPDAVVEACRGIRLSLVTANGGAGPVAVAITSPGSGDGKSFVSSNLALAFGHANYRTLLVDADLRRGALHRLLNLPRQPGLTDYLGGGVSLERVIQRTSCPSLDFVAGGSRRQDAPELLSSPRMADLMSGLRSTYDVVIVDTPPLGAGVDALAVASLSKNLIMVLRLGRTELELAEAKLEALRNMPVRLLGVVLNGVREASEYRAYAYYLDGYAVMDQPLFRPLVAGQKAVKPGVAAG
jgi:capsular exopolysaccharide synthesis family protein